MVATKHCAYGTCNSDSRYSHKEYMLGVTFSRFPTVKKRKEKVERWVKACGRQGFTINQVNRDTYLCSKHFPGGNGPTSEFPDPIPASYTSEQVARFSRRRKQRTTATNAASTSTSTTQQVCTNTAQQEVSTSTTHQQMLPEDDTSPMDTDNMLQELDPASMDIAEEVEVPLYDPGEAVTLEIVLDKDTQTDFHCAEVTALKIERVGLIRQIQSLKGENEFIKKRMKFLSCRKCPRCNTTPITKTLPIDRFDINSIKNDSEQVRFYTGLHYLQICTLWTFLGDAASKLLYWNKEVKHPEISPRKRCGPKRVLTPLNELFLTLMRLRLGLLHRDLAYRFCISESHVTTIVITWVSFLSKQFERLRPLMFPSRDIIKRNMPYCFKQFKQTRCIIDCTEFFVQQASHFGKQGNLYSSYKSHSTYKVLVGICPNGAISFVSDVFEGSISDRQIVVDSGFIDLLEEGDVILADRGFNIVDIFLEKKITLFKPPHILQRERFTPAEEAQTKVIAKLRIHVERAIERLKKFRLLQRSLPLSLEPIVSQVVFVCGCLVNFQEPLVK